MTRQLALTEQAVAPEVVHCATTQSEREAIYRLRYEVYVEELNKDVPTADHKNRWLRDIEDHEKDVTLFYTGTADEATGTVRIHIRHPGTVPSEVRQRFSLDYFPGLEQVATAEASRLIVTKRLRGTLLPSLADACYRHLAKNHVYICFSYCVPNLLGLYRRLGYRTYPSKLISQSDGLRVPVINFLTDLRYYREVRSPLSPLAHEWRSCNSFSTFDLKKYIHLMDRNLSVQTDTTIIWEELQTRLLEKNRVSLFDGISHDDIKKLIFRACIVDTRPGQIVAQAEVVDRDVFIVIDGLFEELTPDGCQVAVQKTGDSLGEPRLFPPNNHRPISIRSLTLGKILILNSQVLATVLANTPAVAARFLRNVGLSTGRPVELSQSWT